MKFYIFLFLTFLIEIIALVSCGKNLSSRAKIFDLGINEDVTKELQNYIDNNNVIFIKPGVYKVSKLYIGSGKKLVSDRFKTKILQIDNVNSPILLIKGSDVEITGISLEGSINTGNGEWNHGIAIMPEGMSLNNIFIKDVSVSNVRGDGLYIGSLNEKFEVGKVKIDSFEAENCYRNGLSITSGKDIQIENIKVNKIGFLGLDLESNSLNNCIENISVSNYLGPGVGIIGGKKFCSNIRFSNFLIDGKIEKSNPPFYTGYEVGVEIRNAKDVKLNDINISDFDYEAIKFINQKSDLGVKGVKINGLNMYNNCKKSNDYNCYVNISALDSLKITNLHALVPENRSLFLGNDKPSKTSQTLILNNSSILGKGFVARYIRLIANEIKVEGSNIAFQCLHENSSITNSSFKKINILNSCGNKLKLTNSFFDEVNSMEHKTK